MRLEADLPLPETGIQVNKACGWAILFEKDTPRAVHGGKWIFFCLPACRESFEKDPQTSCLACQDVPGGEQ